MIQTFRTILFTAIGYISGSLMFARYFGQICCKRDITAESPDKNPGTFNAFRYGGLLCGTFTLCGDLLKGFLPVFLYRYGNISDTGIGLAFVLAAPVFGHIFRVFHRFRGGKGIAVSFGCLLGLLPEVRPLMILAFVFLFFSLVVRITPNYHRTFLTYLISVICMMLFIQNSAVLLGFSMVAVLIICKFLRSSERKEPYKVGILWKH